MRYYHPAETVELYRKSDKSTMEHLWYKLNFFQAQEIRPKDRKGAYELKCEEMHVKLQPTPYQKKLAEKNVERQWKAAAWLREAHAVRFCSARIQDKLVNGLGAAHVRETALTLHPVYGVPYIPGSSLKGLMRHWMLQAFFGGEEPGKQASASHPEVVPLFLDLFGSKEKKGLLQCYDAWICDYVIEQDILTPHFPKYYRAGEEAATDDQSPVPVGFYVLTSGEMKVMLTVARVRTATSGYSAEELLEYAYLALNRALTELGIGAKTASGYGLFAHVADATGKLADLTDEIKAQRMKRKQEAEAEREEAALAAMSPAEQLVYKIKHLEESESDRELSKSLYHQVIEMAQSGDLAPAAALKEYWIKVGEWKVKPKKKQYDRVQALKGYLET